ncbi:hypothetical protein M9H77_35000 [Catharanthus roseus]|uniref:Uncharacterized protein n=1 Tax=Catharanthus roseus TaxID=4058 RepID=A0ACB9ZN19_CATRO|nr:hypothetical protein M9H77_35000 [Catharanthus roseus]
MNKLDAYGRLLHHMISNIIIPNVGHKSSITNIHFFVMLALHEHRRMNFGFMAIEHSLATQTSSTKYFLYGCFLTKVFQYFVQNLVGVRDHIGIGKIYNKHTFKRIGFSRNEEENRRERVEKGQKMHKRSLKGNLQKCKRSLKITRFYEDEVIKLKNFEDKKNG